MRRNRSMPDAVVIPVLAYPDVTAAAKWLCEVFGFKIRLRIGSHRIQLSYDGCAIVVSQGHTPSSAAAASHSIMVRVTDIDEHFRNVQRGGGKVIGVPTSFPFGERQYTIEDVGGHLWTFSESLADIDPREWGGELLADERDT